MNADADSPHPNQRACAVVVLVPILEVSGKPPERVKQQSAAARVALARCAEKCGAPAEGWRQNADGAPLPNEGFYWSLSHKRRWAGAVIARSPVGLDIEEIAPRSPELFDKIGSPGEWDLLGGRTWENFFRLWTAKEATLKANSRGIGYLADCTLVAVRESSTTDVQFGGETWRVRQFAWDEHTGAVAGIASVEWETEAPEISA
jgi:4'-phosphopantetheinyl transferase